MTSQHLVKILQWKLSICVAGILSFTLAALFRSAHSRLPDLPTSPTGIEQPEKRVVSQDREKAIKRNWIYSESWLRQSRISNVEHEDASKVLDSITASHELLGKEFGKYVSPSSLCHPESPFLQPIEPDSKGTNPATPIDSQRRWIIRILYTAIHSLHHGPAVEEAKWRQTNEPPSNIGNYDFECPSERFLVTSVPSAGFGASLRRGTVNALLLGLSLNRTTLFLSNVNSTKITAEIVKPQLLSGCKRADLQCFFLPTTPCVVTTEALENEMVVLPNKEIHHMRTHGILPNASLASERYIYLPPLTKDYRDFGVKNKSKQAIFSMAQTLVKQYTNSNPQDQSSLRMKEALESFADYNLTDVHDLIRQASIMYLMRVNNKALTKVGNIVDSILPPSFDPERSLSIAIRGSDKCKWESTCFDFETYMEFVGETWSSRFSHLDTGHLILTTEDASIMAQSKKFKFQLQPPRNRSSTPSLNIITNGQDVLQDTGRLKKWLPRYSQNSFMAKKYHSRSNEILTATLTAIKLHTYPVHNIGNCCSNFHLLLFDLLDIGCGRSQIHECMNYAANPKYRMKCFFKLKKNSNATR